jgi:hypothetical protein
MDISASLIAEWVTGIGTWALVAVAYWQLSEIAKQARIQGDREKQWNTIAACQRWTNDQILVEAKRRIWAARKNGTQESIEDPGSVRQDVIFIVNYLDTVGIGVRQGVYLEKIVKDHLVFIIEHAVTSFVENGWGDFKLSKAQLSGLMYLYERFKLPDTAHKAVP